MVHYEHNGPLRAFLELRISGIMGRPDPIAKPELVPVFTLQAHSVEVKNLLCSDPKIFVLPSQACRLNSQMDSVLFLSHDPQALVFQFFQRLETQSLYSDRLSSLLL